MRIAWKMVLCGLLAICSLVACGAVEMNDPARSIKTSETLDVDFADGKEDRPGQWKAKTDGMTMWLDTTLKPEWSRGKTYWVARGAVSKTLSGFRAYTSSGHHFKVNRLSKRTFSVVFDPDEIVDVLAGERVYFDFFPTRGTTPIYHGTARYAPRFGRWDGTPRLFVFRAINPVYAGSELRFRGRATARSGHELDFVYTDDDAAPAMTEEAPRRYRLDWSPRALLLAADPPEDPVYFRVSDGAEAFYEKKASIELRLVQIGVTNEPPLQTWPPMGCQDDVRQCLLGLDDGETEECGYANEVDACFGEVDSPLAADEARFVADLKREIAKWYERHADDARAMGDRPLQTALDSIHPRAVGRVDNADEGESFDYDPEYYDIFYHRDPVFPGSDRIWYGVYEPSGLLRTIYAVN